MPVRAVSVWTHPSASSAAQDGSCQNPEVFSPTESRLTSSPPLPSLPSGLSGFAQTPSSSVSWRPSSFQFLGPHGTILSPEHTLSPLLTLWTLLRRNSPWEVVVDHLQWHGSPLFPSWCPVTFLVHTSFVSMYLLGDFGFGVHLSPLCSKSIWITLI